VIRQPVAAGIFYPADSARLAESVDTLLAGAEALPRFEVRGLVAPHAGYVYSGTAAATALALARGAERVALLGPSHFVPLEELAVSGADAWSTPLGAVAVARDLREVALEAGALIDDVPHARDHALEVELPFLQRACRPGLEILPVAVGRASAEAVATFVEALGVPVVVSTDLSHYHDDAAARKQDRATAEAVLRREPAAIRRDAACGFFALRGLVELACRARLEVRLLDLRTSADAGGDPQRVVGYGAFAVGVA
jgi:AmmeMemoRadiSam system protein B